MTIASNRKASEPTLRALLRLREQGRLTAEEAVAAARVELQARHVELEQARARLATLTLTAGRSESRVTAGALQRKQACEVALVGEHSRAAAGVRRALVAVAESQRALERAEQAWRDARGQERSVEHAISRREVEGKRNAQRVEDDDNDDLAQRR